MQVIRNQEGYDVAHIENNKLFSNSGTQLGEVVGNKVYNMKSVYLGKVWNDMILVSTILAPQTPSSAEKLGVTKTQRLPSIKGVKRIIPTGYRSVFG